MPIPLMGLIAKKGASKARHSKKGKHTEKRIRQSNKGRRATKRYKQARSSKWGKRGKSGWDRTPQRFKDQAKSKTKI